MPAAFRPTSTTRSGKRLCLSRNEKPVQTAFQEVTNGLAARKIYGDQLYAQNSLVKATQNYYDLAEHHYRLGLDSNLIFLDAQRLLFNSQKTLINDCLAQLIGEINLHRTGRGMGGAP